MPTVYLPSLIQIRAQYSPYPDTGEIPENVFWFLSRSAGTPTLANLTTMANTFSTQWGGIWALWGATARTFTGAIVTDWSSAFGLTFTNVGVFSAHAGTATGQAPPQVAGLVSFSNGEHFKGGHFRIYLPWLGTAVISTTDPGQLTAAAVTNMFNNYSGLEPAMNATGVLGGQTQRLFRWRSQPGRARLDPIQTYTVQSMLATQRRRLRRIA